MNTILIIEKDKTEFADMVGILEKILPGSKLLTAADEDTAFQFLDTHSVDIITCSLIIPNTEEFKTISWLTDKYPYIPLIAIGEEGARKSDEAHKLGAYSYIERPFATDLLSDKIDKLIDTSSGLIKGIPTPSLLQMLESDCKTCTIQLEQSKKNGSPSAKGYIYMFDGHLIGADYGALKNEKAIYEMIRWDNPIIHFGYFNGKKKNEINKPLIFIILEGMRLKDEQLNQCKKQINHGESKPRFKSLFVEEHSISFNLGTKLTLEFNEIKHPFRSTLVGMLPEEHLIVGAPDFSTLHQSAPKKGSCVQVKYIYMGKFCLFKTEITKTLKAPENLFFLNFPRIIHYHQLWKNERMSIFIPCTFSLDNKSLFNGALIDISHSGSLLQLTEKKGHPLPAIELDKEVFIHCLFPGIKDEIKIVGFIKNYRKDKHEMKIGVEFYDLYSHVQNVIDSYLDSIGKTRG